MPALLRSAEGVGRRGGVGRGGRDEERNYVEEKEEDKGRMTGREDEGRERKRGRQGERGGRTGRE